MASTNRAQPDSLDLIAQAAGRMAAMQQFNQTRHSREIRQVIREREVVIDGQVYIETQTVTYEEETYEQWGGR